MPSRDSNDEENQTPTIRSEMSGTASDVVQAGEIHGGIHFHSAGPGEPIPRQLPGDIGGFVNRLDELNRLNDALADGRDRPLAAGVYVISGTAGVGKTSLALHWAHGVRHRFPGGQLYVNLHGYDPGPRVSPERALNRFLRAMGVPAGSIPTELEDKA